MADIAEIQDSDYQKTQPNNNIIEEAVKTAFQNQVDGTQFEAVLGEDAESAQKRKKKKKKKRVEMDTDEFIRQAAEVEEQE